MSLAIRLWVLKGQLHASGIKILHFGTLPKSDSLFHLEVLDKSALYYNVELVKGNCNDIRCLASFSERNQNISFKVNRNDNNYLAIHAPINVINSLNLQLKCVASNQ